MEQQNQQFIQEKTESKPPLKTNWKYVAIVVCFAILVGGGVFWYVRSLDQQISQLETSNVTLQIPKEKKLEVDTSTWQTYRNEEFGFEARYPKDLREDVSKSEENRRYFSKILMFPKAYFSNTNLESVSLEIGVGWGNYGVHRPCRRTESAADTYRIKKKVIMNGIYFQIASWFYTPPIFGYEYSTEKENVCYQITLILSGNGVSAITDEYLEMKPLFNVADQILSRFGFLR